MSYFALKITKVQPKSHCTQFEDNWFGLNSKRDAHHSVTNLFFFALVTYYLLLFFCANVAKQLCKLLFHNPLSFPSPLPLDMLSTLTSVTDCTMRHMTLVQMGDHNKKTRCSVKRSELPPALTRTRTGPHARQPLLMVNI